MIQCYSTGDGNVSFLKGHMANTIELVHPSTPSSPHPRREMDRFSHFCTAYGRKCLYFKMGALVYQNCPFPCNTCFRPMRVDNPNGTSIGSVVCAHMAVECLYTLQWFACFPLRIAPSHVGIYTSCNTWFIGPTWVWNANGNLVVSAVFAGFTSVTDWQIDRQTDRTRYSVRGGVNAQLCGIRQSRKVVSC